MPAEAERVAEGRVDWADIFRLAPPPQMAQTLRQLLPHPFPPREWWEARVRVEGVGFEPVAVIVGAGAGIAGAIPAVILFESIGTVVTSPEVASGAGPFALAKSYINKLMREVRNLEVMEVPFSEMPEGAVAERLRELLRRGALVVSGASVELALWLGRNAGVKRLLLPRPANGVMVYKYL